MFAHRIPIVLATLVAFGCSESAVAPTPDSDGMLQASVGRVLHRVTVGSPDILGPGGDANFSLVALQGTQGVSGQWHDRFAGGGSGNGVYATVNCLVVDGNQAWISGVDRNGAVWLTRVRDNGTSANDPADQLSFSFGPFDVSDGIDCNGRFGIPLFDTPQGQVVVVQ